MKNSCFETCRDFWRTSKVFCRKLGPCIFKFTSPIFAGLQMKHFTKSNSVFLAVKHCNAVVEG